MTTGMEDRRSPIGKPVDKAGVLAYTQQEEKNRIGPDRTGGGSHEARVDGRDRAHERNRRQRMRK